MAMWTSGRAVVRDLSLAQGGRPPRAAALRPEALHAAERPPRRAALLEETEEAYFRPFAVDGEEALAPDLGFIQQMLNMVRELNMTEEAEPDDVAIISKLNPLSEEFKPKSAKDKSKHGLTPTRSPACRSPEPRLPAPKELRRKRQRNIAIESILQSLQNNNTSDISMCKGDHLTVLKPEDLITTFPENLNKSTTVNIKTRTERVKTHRTTIKIDNTGSMFKKKKKTDIEQATFVKTEPPLERKVGGERSGAHDGAYVPRGAHDGAYEAPARAAAVYRYYAQRSRLAEALRLDIWAEAERAMKEKELRRREEVERWAAEAEVAADDTDAAAGAAGEATDADPLAAVRLAGPRHALASACVVCERLTRPPAGALSPPPRAPAGRPPAGALPPPPRAAAGRPRLQRVPTVRDLTRAPPPAPAPALAPCPRGRTPVSWEALLSEASDDACENSSTQSSG